MSMTMAIIIMAMGIIIAIGTTRFGGSTAQLAHCVAAGTARSLSPLGRGLG